MSYAGGVGWGGAAGMGLEATAALTEGEAGKQEDDLSGLHWLSPDYG